MVSMIKKKKNIETGGFRFKGLYAFILKKKKEKKVKNTTQFF